MSGRDDSPTGERGSDTDRRKRALSDAGGRVEIVGERATGVLLCTALSGGLNQDDARSHVHGFHSYTARMHPTLAGRLIEIFAPGGGVVLDPFCGSGTVLVEARLGGRTGVGIDLSPLAVRLAQLKTRGATPAEARKLVEAAIRVQAHAERRRRERAGTTRHYPDTDIREFDPHILMELDGLRDGLRSLAPGYVADALWLVLSSMLTKVSRKRGDTGEVQSHQRRLAAGFAIRHFVRKTEELAVRIVEFSNRLPPRAPPASVRLGDARTLPGIRAASVDLVLCSPPYAGTYDYLSHQATRLRWLKLDASGLEAAEIGARRKLEPLGESAGTEQFNRDLVEVLGAVRGALRPRALALLVMADSVIAGKPFWALENLQVCCRRAGLGWIAAARQPRAPVHRASAFLRRGRCEIVAALRRIDR